MPTLNDLAKALVCSQELESYKMLLKQAVKLEVWVSLKLENNEIVDDDLECLLKYLKRHIKQLNNAPGRICVQPSSNMIISESLEYLKKTIMEIELSLFKKKIDVSPFGGFFKQLDNIHFGPIKFESIGPWLSILTNSHAVSLIQVFSLGMIYYLSPTQVTLNLFQAQFLMGVLRSFVNLPDGALISDQDLQNYRDMIKDSLVTAWEPNQLEHAKQHSSIREMVITFLALSCCETQWIRMPLELTCYILKKAIEKDKYQVLFADVDNHAGLRI